MEQFAALGQAFKILEQLKPIDERRLAFLKEEQVDPCTVFRQVSLGNYVNQRRLTAWLRRYLGDEVREADVHSWIKFYDYDGNARVSFSEFQSALGWELQLDPRANSAKGEAQLAGFIGEEALLLSEFFRVLGRSRSLPRDVVRKLDRMDKGFLSPTDLEDALRVKADYSFIAHKITKSNRDKILPHELTTVILHAKQMAEHPFVEQQGESLLGQELTGTPTRLGRLEERETIVNKLGSARNSEIREFNLPVQVTDSKYLKQSAILVQNPRQTTHSSNQNMKVSFVQDEKRTLLRSNSPSRVSFQDTHFKESRAQELRVTRDLEQELRGQLSALQKALQAEQLRRKQAEQESERLRAQNGELREKLRVIESEFRGFIGVEGKIQAIDKQLFLLTTHERTEKQHRTEYIRQQLQGMLRMAKEGSCEQSTGGRLVHFSSQDKVDRRVKEHLARVCEASSLFFQFRHKFFVLEEQIPSEAFHSPDSLCQVLNKHCPTSQHCAALLFKEIKFRVRSTGASALKRLLHSAKASRPASLEVWIKGATHYLQTINNELRGLERSVGIGPLLALLGEGRVCCEGVVELGDELCGKGREMASWLGMTHRKSCEVGELREMFEPVT